MKELIAQFAAMAVMAVLTMVPVWVGLWAAGLRISPLAVWGLLFGLYDAVTVIAGILQKRAGR